MDERTEQRILDKASYVRDAVTVLAGKREELSFEEYCAHREQRDIVEREFETAIEACIDIGELLLASTDVDVPETNAAVFRRLGDSGVLEEELADRMAMAAGFRNVLSHQYGDEIDDRDVFNFLQTELPCSNRFSGRSEVNSTDSGHNNHYELLYDRLIRVAVIDSRYSRTPSCGRFGIDDSSLYESFRHARKRTVTTDSPAV